MISRFDTMEQQQAERQEQQQHHSHLARVESAPAAMQNIPAHTSRKAAAEKLRRMSDDVHEWRFDFRSVFIGSYQSNGSFVRRVVRRVSLSLWGESCQEESEEEEEEEEAKVSNRKLQRPNSVQ